MKMFGLDVGWCFGLKAKVKCDVVAEGNGEITNGEGILHEVKDEWSNVQALGWAASGVQQ